jgi:uridine kinase
LPQYDLWRAKPLVLVDGLWLLHTREMRRRFALSIFIDCPECLRFERRLRRDRLERGRTESFVRQQFYERTAPMHGQHVLPQSRWADLVLTGLLDHDTVRRVAKEIEKVIL